MPWLSLPDYARRTVTPESTVRALIRAGKLEGHQEQRAPGDPRMVWKVWVDDPQGQPQEHPQPSSDSIEGQQPQQAAAPPTTETPAAITGLLEIVTADRETIREKDGQILAATERAARAEAERDAARMAAADLVERLRLAEWRWWHRWTKG